MNIKLPQTIYKYRDWKDSYHKNIVIKNQLYITSPFELNDPFDCKPNIDISLITTNEDKLNFIYKHIEQNEKTLENIDKNRLTIELFKRFDELIKVYLNEEEDRSEMRNKYQGVISFSTIWNNILMWSHYSKNHTGFCIGFKTQRLLDSNEFYFNGKVKYSNDFPIINPLNNNIFEDIESTLFVKSNNWKYEKEFRLTKSIGYSRTKKEFKKSKLFKFEESCIRDITFGLRMNDKEQSEITNHISEKKIKIPIYKIENPGGSFKLVRKRIN